MFCRESDAMHLVGSQELSRADLCQPAFSDYWAAYCPEIKDRKVDIWTNRFA